MTNMERTYPVRQRMALPGQTTEVGGKPPISPFQRQSLNTSNNTAVKMKDNRLSQPLNMSEGLSKSGREPIRRKKPVPMPRTAFAERAIDVPPEFDSCSGRRGAISNGDELRKVKRRAPQRPQSMMEDMNPKENHYRVCINNLTVFIPFFTHFTI